MKVKLRLSPRGEYIEKEVSEGTRVLNLYEEYKDQLEYTPILCKIDNEYKALYHVIDRDCRVELLDMRNPAANIAYQHSLSLLYITAASEVLPGVRIDIENSLNLGLYTEIKSKEPVTDDIIAAIKKRMEELVEQDILFHRESYSPEEGLEILRSHDMTEKVKLIESADNVRWIKCFSIRDYRDFFYGLMAPSTGFIRIFDLVRYKRGVILRFPLPKEPDRLPPYVEQEKLYQAFSEQTIRDKLLGVSYVSDLNKAIAENRCKELIQVSEALHEKKIAEIADEIKAKKKRLVLIAGPSSSGKTTFARRLCVQLKVNGVDTLYLGTDDYFVEREDTPLDENGERNYEDLSAIDIDLFNSNMNDLLAGKEVDLPTFNFMTGHKEYGSRVTSIKGNQTIVIEGIHGLNEELTKSIPKEEKFKIYISPLTSLGLDEHNRISTTEERMLRRMVRDYQFRGHKAQQTIAGWPKVRAGENKNIFPYSSEADVLFNSYHVYEIAVLKKYAEPLLKAIGPDEPEYAEARRIRRFLNFFNIIEDDSIIVNNSIMREFIGGSVFVD